MQFYLQDKTLTLLTILILYLHLHLHCTTHTTSVQVRNCTVVKLIFMHTCGYSHAGLEGLRGSDLLYLSATASSSSVGVSQPSLSGNKENRNVI